MFQNAEKNILKKKSMVYAHLTNVVSIVWSWSGIPKTLVLLQFIDLGLQSAAVYEAFTK